MAKAPGDQPGPAAAAATASEAVPTRAATSVLSSRAAASSKVDRASSSGQQGMRPSDRWRRRADDSSARRRSPRASSSWALRNGNAGHAQWKGPAQWKGWSAPAGPCAMERLVTACVLGERALTQNRAAGHRLCARSRAVCMARMCTHARTHTSMHHTSTHTHVGGRENTDGGVS